MALFIQQGFDCVSFLCSLLQKCNCYIKGRVDPKNYYSLFKLFERKILQKCSEFNAYMKRKFLFIENNKAINYF